MSFIGLSLEHNLTEYGARTRLGLAQGVTNAATRMSVRAKLAFRDDIRRAGLGDRLANTWQDKVYPLGKPSMHAAAFVYSKAPQIIAAFTEGALIQARGSAYLAIPTDNVPHAGKIRMTVADVERRFGKIILVKSKTSQNLLGFVDVAAAKSGAGFRKRTRGRADRAHHSVLMFVFVRQVRLAKRLDWPHVAENLTAEWENLLAEETAKQIGN